MALDGAGMSLLCRVAQRLDLIGWNFAVRTARDAGLNRWRRNGCRSRIGMLIHETLSRVVLVEEIIDAFVRRAQVPILLRHYGTSCSWDDVRSDFGRGEPVREEPDGFGCEGLDDYRAAKRRRRVARAGSAVVR